MSVLGVVIGLIGLVASVVALFLGTIGGIIAGVLGLLAVIFGFLAKKGNKYKGTPAIVLGIIAVILAIALAATGINIAKKALDQVKASPDKSPTLSKYLDKVNTSLGIYGFFTAVDSTEDQKLISDELSAILRIDANPAATAAPAATEVPAATEAPAEGEAQG